MNDAFLSIVISGLVLGSLYSLMSTGLSLTWSTLRIFNFAHGAFMTLGAYLAWTFLVFLHLPVLVGLFLALLCLSVSSILFQYVFISPFLKRQQGDLLVMVTTLSAMTIITTLIQATWGPHYKQLPTLIEFELKIGATTIGANQLMAIVLAPVLSILVSYLLAHTRLGLAIRAVEQNRNAARLVGIEIQGVQSITIISSTLLAGIAGILLGGITFVSPVMGDDPLLKAFVVVIFGGLAKLSGSIYGAYVFGFMESLSTYAFGLFWTPIVIFTVMIFIMLFRPEGLMRGRTS